MGYKRGDKLELVIGSDINWAKEGDMLIFLRKSKNYEDDKGIGVTDAEGNVHFVKEYRLAEFGNKSAIAKCKANAPKLYVVLQDSCRNYIGERASIGLEDTENFAKDGVVSGEPLTIYKLVPVKKVTREPTIVSA